jgi:hypothetical protein
MDVVSSLFSSAYCTAANPFTDRFRRSVTDPVCDRVYILQSPHAFLLFLWAWKEIQIPWFNSVFIHLGLPIIFSNNIDTITSSS